MLRARTQPAALLILVATYTSAALAQDTTRAPRDSVVPVAHGAVDSAAASAVLTDEEIAEAIAWGVKHKKPYAYTTGSAAGGVSGALFRASELAPSIYIIGPFGRVATEAAEATRKYKPYDRSTVSRDALAPIVAVRIDPPKPSSRGFVREEQIHRIEHVVLRPRKPKNAPVVQPTRTDTSFQQWQNGFGATFERTGLTAYFDRDAIPQEDFDLVIITDGKEDRYLVRRKDLPAIR